MGIEFKMGQEYFTEFDPEKFAEMIRAQAADEAADKAADGVDKQ